MAYVSSRPYPYLPEGKSFGYVPEDDKFISIARQLTQPIRAMYPEAIVNASVIVKDGEVIGSGTNTPVHKSFCPRTVFGSPSGQDYELCKKYCHSDNHSEPNAIADAKKNGHNLQGADLYLFGHWWSCKGCWDKMTAAGIRNVFLVEGATEKFYQAVSSKGEPDKKVKIFVEGDLPNPLLPEMLKKVKIFLVPKPEANFVYNPKSGLSDRDWVVRLQEELETAAVYN